MKRIVSFSMLAVAAAAFAAWDAEEVNYWTDMVLRQDMRYVMTPDTPGARRDAAEHAKSRQSATGEMDGRTDDRIRHQESQQSINRRSNALAREIKIAFTNNLAKTEELWLSEHVGARKQDFQSFAYHVVTNGNAKISRKFIVLGAAE